MTLQGRDDTGRWVEVTSDRPCPVCGGTSWCSVSADGSVIACRRQEAGCFKSKQDRLGARAVKILSRSLTSKAHRACDRHFIRSSAG